MFDHNYDKSKVVCKQLFVALRESEIIFLPNTPVKYLPDLCDVEPMYICFMIRYLSNKNNESYKLFITNRIHDSVAMHMAFQLKPKLNSLYNGINSLFLLAYIALLVLRPYTLNNN